MDNSPMFRNRSIDLHRSQPVHTSAADSMLTSSETEEYSFFESPSHNHNPLRNSMSAVPPTPEKRGKPVNSRLDSSVLEWLKYIGMEQYAENFARNGYDNIKVCGNLNPQDIEALGLKNALPGHKKSLLVYSKELGELIYSQQDLRLKYLAEKPFTEQLLFRKKEVPRTQPVLIGMNDVVTKDTPKADKMEHAYLKQSSYQQRQEFLEWSKIDSEIQPQLQEVDPAFNDQRIHVKEKEDFLQFFKTQRRIVLARHGTSVAHHDRSVYTKVSDHAVPLSTQGEAESIAAGKALRKYYEEHFGVDDVDDDMYHETNDNNNNTPNSDDITHNDSRKVPPPKWHCRMWTSPYLRARKSAELMMNAANEGFLPGQGWITDLREHVLLAEQQFGLFEGVDWDSPELERRYPVELEYYRKAERWGGRFWAKVPLGESRLDVAQRVHHSFHTFRRDAEAYGIDKIVIVSHGLPLRAFLMMWLNQRPEWLEAEPNPQVSSLRVIDPNGTDEGYIHPKNRNPTEVKRLDPLLSAGDRKVEY